MERWSGHLALITGASSGIGESLTKELARHGMKVAALARRVEKLQKLEQECKTYKGVVKIYKCDISDENEITATVKAVLNDLGPISVLINNAAQLIPNSLVDPAVSCRKIYETNVIGMVTLTQQIVQAMKKHNITDGHIINVNSIVGHCVTAIPGIANYCASKNAIRVLTESLKNELSAMKFNTRVTSLSPGCVKTEMTEAFFKQHAPKKIAYLATKDINDCVIFLLGLNQNVNISEMIIQPTGETHMSFFPD